MRVPILDEVVTNIRSVIDDQRKIWRKKGYNILSDGWKDRSGRDLLNFLVSPLGGLIFPNSMDTSKNKKNGDYLFN